MPAASSQGSSIVQHKQLLLALESMNLLCSAVNFIDKSLAASIPLRSGCGAAQLQRLQALSAVRGSEGMPNELHRARTARPLAQTALLAADCRRLPLQVATTNRCRPSSGL